MEVKKFRLSNVGRFSDLEIPLAPTKDKTSNMTVLVGNNGSGKTTLLHALATSLSWFVGRVRYEKGSGSPISEDVINNQASTAVIDIDVWDKRARLDDSLFSWHIAKTIKGHQSEGRSALSELSELANHYKAQMSANDASSLPLLAFYPVERSVIDIPLKINNRHSFQQIDGYDDSLNRGVDFRRFFEWFREREDTENEQGISNEVFDIFKERLGNNNKDIWEILSKVKDSSLDRQLTAVRTAISTFMPGFNNLRIRRKPRLHMSIDKQGERLNVAQLSQGEKSLLALVGDIAKRLAMMNPALENPLHGDGIVMIDEVDLHLHPQWQRTLLARLSNTFPNCQFVLTTHSPLVISEAKDVLCYVLNDGELSVMDDTFGLDANQVLSQVMNTDVRNTEIQTQLDDLMDAMQDRNLQHARELLSQLRESLPSGNIEITKAELLLRRLELRLEKNQ
ncbi:MAG: AAA family ATPase [Mariprofundaceae bacterium]|nr:AAA family ATPase [Mariprofundaceae bacterium]